METGPLDETVKTKIRVAVGAGKKDNLESQTYIKICSFPQGDNTKTAPEAVKHTIKATGSVNGINGELKYQMPPLEAKKPNRKLIFIRFMSVAIISMGIGAGGGILVYRQLVGDPASLTSSETEDPGDSLAMEAEEGTTTVGTPGGFDDILSPLPGGGGFAEIFPPMVGEDGGFSPPSSNWGLQRGGTEVMGGFVMEGNHDDSRKVDFLQLTCDFDGVPCDWHTRLDWSVKNEKLGSISEEGINQTGNYLFSQENLPTLATFTSHIVREPNKYGSFCLSFTFYKSNRSGLLAVYLLDHETQDMNQIWKEDAPSRSWRRAHVNISTSREFMILIEAEHDGDNTVIAIDDIEMTNTTCAVRQDLPAVPPQPIADLLPTMPGDMAIPEFPDMSGLPAELPSRQPGNLPDIAPEENGGMKFPEFLDRRGRPESTLFE